MEVVALVLLIVVSVLLVLIVLAQNSKGGMGALGGAAAGASSMMGVKKTADLLEKLTWGFAIFILVVSFGFNMYKDGDSVDKSTIESKFSEDKGGNVNPVVDPNAAAPAAGQETVAPGQPAPKPAE